MNSPYKKLPGRAFWRSAVSQRAALDPGDLYQKKFPISRTDKIVTAGSCFAQHVGRSLKQAGFNVLDTEPLPSTISDETAQKYGYRLYSARYGNIYTVRQLAQLMDEIEGKTTPAEPVWEKNGRFFDAFRPSVEPDGLASPEHVKTHRAQHLKSVDLAFSQAQLFVFTLGLTEAWRHRETGAVYPTAPGTIAGSFDPDVFEFINYGFADILADFENVRARMMLRNPDIRFLVTTSPVPLTATATGGHVEVATCYSKSVLRAVCGQLAAQYDNVDYFPSYEIITSTNNRGVYFESNKRSVSPLGVQTAMHLFMEAHDGRGPGNKPGMTDVKGDATPQSQAASNDDVVCEEALLEAFAK